MNKTRQIPQEQLESFKKIVLKSQDIREILDQAPSLGLPNWYLGAGCLAHTVWNVLSGFDITNGILDYDLVYFDEDTSYEKEDGFIHKGKELFKRIGIDVEIRNEARVHLWYEDHFGSTIPPYKSVEAAINTWPTTATMVGIRKVGNDIKVYAPVGLDDLLGMVMRPNKIQITEDIYLKKVERWSKVWPNLNIISW